MTRPFAGAIAALALLLSGSAPVWAQASTHPNATAAKHKPAKPPAPKPVAAAAPSYDGDPGRLSDYWTIEKALPGRPHEDRSRPAAAPDLGRVPLQNASGTLGVASGDIRATQFYDGRPVPGITQNTQPDSSYVGLSLSMKSGSNGFFVPPPPFGSSSGW